MRTLGLFFKIIKLRFLSLIEYPGAFLGGVAAQWLVYLIDIVMLFLIVGEFNSIGGWLPEEVVFLYAVWLLSYAIGASFTFNLANNFSQMGVNGTIDEVLTRPMPTMVYLIASDFNMAYISHISITIVAIAYSLCQLQLEWTLLHWTWFAVLILSGAVIQSCLMLICEMPALRLRGKSPTGIFFWEMRGFAQYPISIYSKAIKFIFTAVLPFGFVNYYPLQVLLKNKDGASTELLKWLSPFVAAFLVLITAVCWHFTLRRYESSGT